MTIKQATTHAVPPYLVSVFEAPLIVLATLRMHQRWWLTCHDAVMEIKSFLDSEERLPYREGKNVIIRILEFIYTL